MFGAQGTRFIIKGAELLSRFCNWEAPCFDIPKRRIHESLLASYRRYVSGASCKEPAAGFFMLRLQVWAGVLGRGKEEIMGYIGVI